MAGCGCGCGPTAPSAGTGADWNAPSDVGRYSLLTQEELQATDCATSLAYKSSVYYGDGLTGKSPFVALYRRLFGDSSAVASSSEVSSLIPRPFTLTWRHASTPQRLSAVVGLVKQMVLQKRDTEYLPKEVDSVLSTVSCRVTDGIQLYSAVDSKNQTADLGLDLIFSPSLKVDVSKRIGRGNDRSLDNFRFGLGVRRTGVESLFKLEFGEALRFRWESLFYLPSFTHGGLLGALPLGWRRPSEQSETADATLENLPALPFRSAAYLKYSFWYLGGGERISKIDKAALAFINEEGLRAEIG